MIITKLIEPWKHFIVEHFFPQNILLEVMSQFEIREGFEPWTGYAHRMGKFVQQYSPLTYEYLLSILPAFIKVCEDDLLERNLPTDASKYCVFQCMFCIDGIGYTVPIHCDTPQKCITFVIYVNGKGSCTSLCKKHGSEYVNSFLSDEFKDSSKVNHPHPIPNSALVFVPKDGITFHTVTPTSEVRHTVQFTIQLK